MAYERQITSWGFIDWIQSELLDEKAPVSIGLVNLLPGKQQAEHTHHSEKQFLYTLTGRGEHIINGKRIPFGPGDYFFMDSGVVHTTINHADEVMQELMVSIPVHLFGERKPAQSPETAQFDPELAADALRDGINRLIRDTLDHVNMPVVLTDTEENTLYSRLLPQVCQDCPENICPLRSRIYELHSDYGTACSSVVCPRGLTVLVQPLVLDNTVCGLIKGGLFRQYPNIPDAAEGIYDVPHSTAQAAQIFLQDINSYLINFYQERKIQRRLQMLGSESGTQALLGEINKELEQLRTNTLNIQIRNHFLFNTLNSIASLAIQDNSMDTYRAIIDLSELLRGLLRREGVRVPLHEEITFLQRYINLQLLRYEENLQITWKRCAGAERTIVPHNFLQPIVENALLHGYNHSNQLKQIHVETALVEGRSVVTIRDNGCGMDTRTLERLRSSLFTGGTHGLSLVTRKLAGVFGEDFSIDITSEPGEGTCFRLSFPV